MTAMGSMVKHFLKAVDDSTRDRRSPSLPYTVPFRGTVGDICDLHGELQFNWKLEHFFTLPQAVNVCYTSPVFYFMGRRFYLQLLPNGDRKFSSEGWIGLFLVAGESCPPLKIRYTLGIKTANGDTEQLRCITHTFGEECVGKGKFKYMKTSELLLRRRELVPSNVLTIVVSLNVGVAQPNRVTPELAVKRIADVLGREAKDGNRTQENADVTTLGQCLKGLYVSGKDSDVILEVKGKTFRAHKLILGARTPVFAAMFSHDTAEAESGVVSVEDCQPEAFEVFLGFVYSGAAENLTKENVTDVFYIADKYDLPSLKKECVRHMLANLAADSVCNVIALAERHGEELLLEGATDFVLETFRMAERQKSMTGNDNLANDFVRGCENSK